MTEKTEPQEPCYALLIAPHPDDSEFSSAGTISTWTGQGRRVVYLICTDGDKGSADPDMTPERLAAIRRREQSAAAAFLGVAEVRYLGHPDQGIEDTPEFRKELVRWIRAYRPEVVLAPDPYRRYIWHRDHRLTGQAVLDAVFPAARDRLAHLDLLEEGLHPHKVKEILFWGTEDVNHRVDITDLFETKLRALQFHQSQIGQRPLEEWTEMLRERARALAAGSPYALAEGFHRVVTPP